MLTITDLHVKVDNTAVLKGLNIHVPAGHLHAIMGPNGAGKSTLSAVLAGHDAYTITQGSIMLNGQDLTTLAPEERASAGLFVALQYPPEIAGIASMVFMRTTVNAMRKRRGDSELSAPVFLKKIKQLAAQVGLNEDQLKRSFNSGFSGGEKKRAEVLQMLLAEPILSVLDEIDSGLDMDALKNIAQSINSLRHAQRSMLMITHYRRLLDYVTPDMVHVLVDGRIMRSGGVEIVDSLESAGYSATVQ